MASSGFAVADPQPAAHNYDELPPQEVATGFGDRHKSGYRSDSRAVDIGTKS